MAGKPEGLTTEHTEYTEMKFIRSPSVCFVYSVVHPSPSFSPFCGSSFPSSSNPLNLNPSVVAKIHQQAQLHTGRFEILTTEHKEYTEMKFIRSPSVCSVYSVVHPSPPVA